MDPAPLLVACLCAEWCLTCKAYRDTLAGVAAAHPDVAFAWVDIEDHADALESDGHEAPDIVNFPTLLVLRGTEPLFFGIGAGGAGPGSNAATGLGARRTLRGQRLATPWAAGPGVHTAEMNRAAISPWVASCMWSGAP